MITPEQEVELQEIAARIVAGTASPEEQATLLKLSELKKKAVAERAEKIKNFVLAIKERGVHFNELAEAFDPAQVLAWSKARGLIDPQVTKQRGPKTKNTNPLLIQFEITPGGKFGAGYRFKQAGQIHEKFVELYKANKDNYEKALSRYFTEDGKEFFATKEGKADLKRVIGVIQRRAEGKPDATKPAAAKKTRAAKKSGT